MPSEKLLQFTNCRILRDHKLVKEDFWVRAGKIINPERVFFDEKHKSDRKVDCEGAIIAPGFIDLQINGGFGVDFSNNLGDIEQGVKHVAQRILSHGVTSFCPTIVTSPSRVYHDVLPRIKKSAGGLEGASVLGVHVEGPFINVLKKGAHPPECIKAFEKGFETVKEIYGSLDNIQIITLAPELEHSSDVIRELTKSNVTVSVGHSMGNLKDGEEAVKSGAIFITHLFNAMLPFHHRDPGLVGLLASQDIPEDKTVFFGIIADGSHTHPAALRIAHRTHPKGLVLVTDAISALGLEEGTHNVGQLTVEIRNRKAFVAGTDTLSGSIAAMNECVRFFKQATGCSIEYALETASWHPALVLGISSTKGTLNFGADADFILLDEDFNIKSTWISGECTYRSE